MGFHRKDHVHGRLKTNSWAKVNEFMRIELDRKSTGKAQVCFIDLRKAFDSLYHTLLLNELEIPG